MLVMQACRVVFALPRSPTSSATSFYNAYITSTTPPTSAGAWTDLTEEQRSDAYERVTLETYYFGIMVEVSEEDSLMIAYGFQLLPSGTAPPAPCRTCARLLAVR